MKTTVKSGVYVSRFFTKKDVHPFEAITWENRDAVLTNMKGETVFEQKNVRVPTSWSQTALNIVASKYLHGKLGTPEREQGVNDLISRVVHAITQSGAEQGHFASQQDATPFAQN